MLPPRPAARVLVVEHQRDGGLGRFAAPLAAAGLRLDVRRPAAGDPLPSDAADLAGLVVLGGEAAAWEDERWPWLPATRTLLLDATARQVPTLGLCLGAQLLALALGGAMDRGVAGPELGLRRVHLRPEAADDPLLGHLPPEPLAPQGHRDTVTRLPAGATWLADGGAYPHQAFRVARTAWGIQWHPEVTRDDFAAWMRADDGRTDVAPGPDHSPTAPFDATAAVAAYDDHEAGLARAARAVATGFASLVRRPAGVDLVGRAVR